MSSRRMVILGDSGSGKTVLARRLTSDILNRCDAVERVPVVLSIGSWDPFEQDFLAWLEQQISMLVTDSGPQVASTEVIPILDGFDEYSSQLMSQAIGILNRRELAELPLVILSRASEYKYNTLWRQELTLLPR